MRVYAESVVFSTATNQDGSNIVIKVPSNSKPGKFYDVDLTAGRCSCPAWVFKKVRVPCVHLKSLGYYDVQQAATIQEIKETQPSINEQGEVIKTYAQWEKDMQANSK